MFDLGKDAFSAGKRELIADVVASTGFRLAIQVAWHQYTMNASGPDLGAKVSGAREFLNLLERVALAVQHPTKPPTNLEREPKLE